MNPAELRETAQSLSRRLESAKATAQESIFTCTELYVDPCLSGLTACLRDFTAPCCFARADHGQWKKGRSRGRAEQSFDFYDDWDDEAEYDNNLMGWGNDEMDSLLSQPPRRHGQAAQPKRPLGMTYGTRGKGKRDPSHRGAGPDATIIPSSSYLGFLQRFPFKLGGDLRYKPSAADLQEHPGGSKGPGHHDQQHRNSPHHSPEGATRRRQSATSDSPSTINSLSSRGDLIPSDAEADAVPLDDEFAISLERRNTGSTPEDHSSKKSRSSRKSRTSVPSRHVSSSPPSATFRVARSLNPTPTPDEAEGAATSPTASSSDAEKKSQLPTEKPHQDEEEEIQEGEGGRNPSEPGESKNITTRPAETERNTRSIDATLQTRNDDEAG